MTYEAAIRFGVDLIFPAVFVFSVAYSFLPFWRTTLGWAMFTHGWSTTFLLAPSLLHQLGLIGEDYPAEEALSLIVVISWIFAWWLLAWAIVRPRLRELRARRQREV